MTHEELLAHIDNYLIPTMQREPGPQNSAIGILKAFRAVVELHKPMADWRKSPLEYDVCGWCGWECRYPCETIQAIEKELG